MEVEGDLNAMLANNPEMIERERLRYQERANYFTCGILLLQSVLVKMGSPPRIGNIDTRNSDQIIEVIFGRCIFLLDGLGIEATDANQRVLFFIILYTVKTSEDLNINDIFTNFIIGRNPSTLLESRYYTGYTQVNGFNMQQLETLLNTAYADITIDVMTSGLISVFKHGIKFATNIATGSLFNEGILTVFEALDLFPSLRIGGKNKKTRKRHNTKKQNKTHRSSKTV